MQFRVVGPNDEAILRDVFANIDESFFRPHPFTPQEAGRIVRLSGHDVFAILLEGDRAVAYGMLRGWDEGYPTPSLGIAVRNDCQSRGLGRLMMEQLHRAAIARGASTVRLRVHPDNTRARRLYETLGYAYGGEERGELVMEVRLDPDPAAERDSGRPGAAPFTVGAPAGVRLIRPDDPSWDATLLHVPRSIFHTAGYHVYARGSGEGEPYLAIVGDSQRGLGWPYLLRSVAGIPGIGGTEATDVHSVYGYPGPVAWGLVPGDPFLDHAMRLIVETWRGQGAVSAFTRFHPLLMNADLLRDLRVRPDQDAKTEGVIAAGPTVSVDLTLKHELVRADYGRGLVRDISVARRAGLRTEPDDGLTFLPIFTELYHETMRRLDAADYYFFSEGDFRRLDDSLPGKLHLLVTFMGDAVAAAGLFIEFGGLVEWHLGCSSDEFRHLAPTKVLVDDAITWARDRGNRILHMGGGHGGREDSLLWFKGRFSPRRHPFDTGRWILEPRLYQELAAARRATNSGGYSLDSDFFPIYRAPFLPDEAA